MASPALGGTHTVGRYSVFMVDSFPFAVTVGILLGFLSGLGTGGGSLLILWLTVVLNMDPLTARSINLLFYIPSALTAILFRRTRTGFSIKHVLPAIIPGCIAAGIFTCISTRLDIAVLKKVFGIILLLIGIKELLYRPRNAK